ncbi:MAG: DUF2249 domain-containing protein [Deltaproteobacteria bacterium]|nr:DUF2249 domain-containing protein [Deltaproteobacteria bacterium]
MEKTVDSLDVREYSPRERHQRIFETFNGLKAGEAFVLINDHEPKPLLYQFQMEYDGAYDWWALESGPEAWRVQIARRMSDDPKRTITEYFETDHRRLDAILNRFQSALKNNGWEDALTHIREFKLGLRRHIKAEEEILFPMFEEKTGMTEAGPTFVMKMEHKDIKETLDKLLTAAESKDAKAASSGTAYLINILGNHNMKEEHILYPESDALLSDAERPMVVKKAQAI